MISTSYYYITRDYNFIIAAVKYLRRYNYIIMRSS